MTIRMKLLVGAGALLSFAGGVALAGEDSAAPEVKKHAVPTSKDGDLVVGLCDGVTSLEVDGVKEGQKLTREQAQRVSGALMEQWLKKNPDANWDPAPVVAQAPTPPKTPGSPPAVPATPQKPSSGGTMVGGGVKPESGGKDVKKQQGANLQDGHTYGAFSQRDEAIWAASTQAFVEEGHRVFHDAELLGGTVAVSCDMCHPDASNTHPETYPKYQVQLGRVALLRDMINWCIENPVRGKPLADDDPKMRAMEAYIYAKRKGTPLEYGKK
ncbi:cytochrome C [Pyxidicoccus sp. MSG2]|nr:cytochrome C [Pyxidicoccus sp. MSG2]